MCFGALARYEVPRQFGAHDALIRQLGARSSPSTADYLQFLRELHAEAGSCSLSLNELRSVLSIVQLAVQGGDGEGGGMFFVPDEGGVLRKANKLVFNDSPWLARRLDHSKVLFACAALPRPLMRRVGVRPLSEAVKEVLTEVEEKGKEEDQEGSFSGVGLGSVQAQERLRAILASMELAQGLERLWEDQVARRQAGDGQAGIPCASHIQRTLARLQLRFPHALRTDLVLRHTGERVSAPIAAAASSKASQSLIFYKEREQLVLVSTKPSPLSPFALLAQLLCKVLRSSLRPSVDQLDNLSPFASMLQLASPDMVSCLRHFHNTLTFSPPSLLTV